jgi:uncharacterized repeat protein (TIGR03843 family)
MTSRPARRRHPDRPLTEADRLAALRDGSLRVVGRLADASNATFYCHATLERQPGGPGAASESARIGATRASAITVPCIYKPVRGERPLWDFPVGTLGNREYAAFLVSDASGWAVAPPTLLRDGPFGPGMVQLWVDVDPDVDMVEMIRTCDQRLRPIALFDAIVNNADRKGGHLLPVPGGHVHGVDHGICFATEPKLRTILWAWRGSAFEPGERAVLERLADELSRDLGDRLREVLSSREVSATVRRLDRLLRTGTFPQPDPDRPAIPWPPF